MVRAVRWTLVVAAALACAYVEGAPKAKAEDTECLEPAAIKSFELKIGELEQTNTALQLQVDEQAAKFADDKSKLLKDIAKEHEEIVLKLQNEIKSLTSDVDALEKDLAKEHAAVEKAEAELKNALAKLSGETARAASLEKDVATLEKNVAKERAAVTEAEAELKAALAKLAEETKRATALEKNSLSAEKRNKALRKELDESKIVELSMAALLSSYYDEGLVWGEQAFTFAQEQLNEQSGAIQQLKTRLGEAKKTAFTASSKFYAENLAATVDPILADVHKTVDPILADVHKAVEPHVATYLPIVQSETAKAKEQIVQFLQEALRRAKSARLEAIAVLEQNEHVAAHAQKVIDGVLIILAVPLVWLQITLVLRLAWWIFTTMLCVATCGLCCRGRKRCSKSKRKTSKKIPAASVNSTLPLNGGVSKKTTTKTTATQKRSKKGKN